MWIIFQNQQAGLKTSWGVGQSVFWTETAIIRVSVASLPHCLSFNNANNYCYVLFGGHRKQLCFWSSEGGEQDLWMQCNMQKWSWIWGWACKRFILSIRLTRPSQVSFGQSLEGKRTINSAEDIGAAVQYEFRVNHFFLSFFIQHMRFTSEAKSQTTLWCLIPADNKFG